MTHRTLKIRCKRAYDTPTAQDGYRLLVDALWPRGVSKEDAALDEWDRALAPSTDLRRWFGHDPRKWAAFYQKYHRELRAGLDSDRIEQLIGLASDTAGLTLVYGARDPEHNNAVALKLFLEAQAHGNS